MSHNIIGALTAAAIGFLIAFVNYLISKSVLVKAPQKYSFITVVRQIVQVGFLALVYFVVTKIQIVDSTYLLVGAVLGLTLPMFCFTKKLLLINEKNSSNTKEKEVETDG
jgi:hypothetical protein